MNDKKQFQLGGLLFAALSILFVVGENYEVKADSEFTVAVDNGTYLETRVITLSNSANTLIVDAESKRPAMLCRNNSAYAVWIGSNMASTNLIGSGFPILSSETFRTDKFTGTIYALLDAGGVGNVRCVDARIR